MLEHERLRQSERRASVQSEERECMLQSHRAHMSERRASIYIYRVKRGRGCLNMKEYVKVRGGHQCRVKRGRACCKVAERI